MDFLYNPPSSLSKEMDLVSNVLGLLLYLHIAEVGIRNVLYSFLMVSFLSFVHSLSFIAIALRRFVWL